MDGPSHYVTSSSSSGALRLNGATQLRNRLLEARGWRMVSVPAVQRTRMPGGQAARLAYLERLME